MMKTHKLGVVLVVMILVFLSASAVHGNLIGKTLTSAFLPGKKAVEPVSPAIADLDEVAVDSFSLPDVPVSLTALIEELRKNPQRVAPLPPVKLQTLDLETLWLARCIYSESKQAREQELVAWVVRNRVETKYRGKTTYKDVVLDPFQFSAFNTGQRKAQFYSSLEKHSRARGWQTAIRIAHDVRYAPPEERPFPLETRHFYSEQSMIGDPHPEWAMGLKPVSPQRDYSISARRFRFFSGIS